MQPGIRRYGGEAGLGDLGKLPRHVREEILPESNPKGLIFSGRAGNSLFFLPFLGLSSGSKGWGMSGQSLHLWHLGTAGRQPLCSVPVNFPLVLQVGMPCATERAAQQLRLSLWGRAS